MLTKLDAINTCLRGVGITAVSSLESGPEAADALATLENASTSLQAVGWWFNKEYNWKIAPNVSGKIVVPTNVIDITEWNTSRLAELTARGGFVYDKVNHSFNLEDAVNADGVVEFVFVVRLDFEDLPEPAKLAVMYTARRLYAQDEESDTNTYQMQTADEQRAMAALWVIEFKHAKRNAFHNTHTAHKLSQIGGWNSQSGVTSTFPRRDA